MLLSKLTLLFLAQAAVPADPNAVSPDIALKIYDAVLNKNWGLAAALAVIGLVWATRKFVPATTKVGELVRSTWGGWALNFVFSIGGSVANAYAAGLHPTIRSLLTSVGTAFIASGGWELLKDTLLKEDAAAAQAAGQAAANNPGPTINK